MKTSQGLLFAALLSGAVALAQPTVPGAVPAPTTAPAAAAAARFSIESIRNAPDPSSAIQAYARGFTAGPGVADEPAVRRRGLADDHRGDGRPPLGRADPRRRRDCGPRSPYAMPAT